MSNLIDSAIFAQHTASSGQEESPTPTLVVGDLVRWQELGHDIPEIDGFYFVDFDDVSIETLGKIRPQVILSPLLGRTFDAVEVARRLETMGYRGRYRVVTDGVPRPDVVKREVNAVAPNLDFSVLLLPRSNKPA